MSEVKVIAASIVNYLKRQLDNESFNIDARESLEVGIQCIETAFEIRPEDARNGIDLLSMYRESRAKFVNEHAELLKNEGNDMMRADRVHEALVKYNRAIDLDPNNSVFYCNRAAAHFKLGQHEQAVADCTAALTIDPNYGKAYGRLGLALSGLDRHTEARVAYAKAVELDPNNETYQQNLRIAEQRIAQAGGENIDIVTALQNPELINMASQMLENPNMRNMVQGLMNNTMQNRGNVGAGGVNAFLEIGQALARHMQTNNPDLVEQLRQQMEPAPRNNANPPNNPPNPPNPSNDPPNPPNTQ